MEEAKAQKQSRADQKAAAAGAKQPSITGILR
eukprot:CAMPEP_0182422132 /NCGR_PEP_ID=MMETSP1167-20130531/7732_1 /TAXON_ID=2988 /ORGANISM="Mallomonas Sp, Strain CCMP3275" /LENGTH=31 /DNA_ID= /DNA_START= /DNA_END= /DNA_ORIENTATION=